MKIISFITERNVIRHILEHLGLSPAKPTRDPPTTYALPDSGRALSAIVSEPYDYGWPGYEEKAISYQLSVSVISQSVSKNDRII